MHFMLYLVDDNNLINKDLHNMSYIPTILVQVINQVSRLDFLTQVKDNSGDKYVKSIFSWHLFVLLIFAHLSNIKSMRHLLYIFNSFPSKHYHLGTHKISLNGLSYALANRPSQVFRNLFYDLLSQIPRKKTKMGRKFNKFVSIIDATCMPLKGTGSSWAQGGKSRREARAHVLIDANGTPLDMVITGASTHEIKGMKELNLGETEVLVMDRAYYGFELWQKLSQSGIIFITRAKKNLQYEVRKNRRGRKPKGVIEDQEIYFMKSPKSRNPKRMTLRRIRIVTKKGQITFLTNDLSSPAREICDLYASRWEIEVFFKWIKQNLKIKRFLGRNQNAIETQLWIAMIVYLVLHMIKRNFSYSGSNLELIRIISVNLLLNVVLANVLSPPIKVVYKDKERISLFNSSGQ